MRNIWISIIMACLLSVCSCRGRSGLDMKFQEIDRLCDSIPEAAIDSLASIDPAGFSEKDLNRYCLLWIKSRDKAYIEHRSDTLILDVIEYYEKHRGEGLYPEALYYGGRVYSDLGDLPTALEFFQKSLDEIPEDDAHLRLRGIVLDQTGRLLHTLRLDSAAIKYLERSLVVNSNKDKDFYNIAFTHSLLSGSYIGIKNYRKAREHMDSALKLSTFLSKQDSLTILTSFARMLLNEKKIESALDVIRPLPSIVDSITTPFCLATAAQIYSEAGIPDTAYIYARQLTRLHAPYNKRTGYKVIFSDKLRNYVPKDTLLILIPDYKKCVEDNLDIHEAEQAIMQNSRFNYSTHVKERAKAERTLHEYRTAFIVSVSILTILLLIVLLSIVSHKFIRVRKESKFMEILNISESLKNETNHPFQNIYEENMLNESSSEVESDYAEIKKSLLHKMEEIKNNKPEHLIDQAIANSEVYKELMEKIKTEKCIADSENIWDRIEVLFETVSPGFFKRLDILTEGNITPSERKVAMLMKFGITPMNISKLLARGRNTISTQRRSLANKISEEKIPLDALDKLIITL